MRPENQMQPPAMGSSSDAVEGSRFYDQVFNPASDVRLPHRNEILEFPVPAGTEVFLPGVGTIELPTATKARRSISYCLLARWTTQWIFLVKTPDDGLLVWCKPGVPNLLSNDITWEAISDDLVPQAGSPG